jgi:hypothetical protein
VPLVRKHLDTTRKFPELFTLIGALGKPVICAANGHCLAGALGLALACDLVIATDKSTFGTPEINVGVFPFIIIALIFRNLPRKKAAELLLLGERIDAHEAQRIGIVNRVVPIDQFDDTVRDWAAKLAAKSPLVMRLAQRRDVPRSGHGGRRRARLPARRSRSPFRPRTCTKACRRSSRSASRCGRGDEVAAACRPHGVRRCRRSLGRAQDQRDAPPPCGTGPLRREARWSAMSNTFSQSPCPGTPPLFNPRGPRPFATASTPILRPVRHVPRGDSRWSA